LRDIDRGEVPRASRRRRFSGDTDRAKSHKGLLRK
jgi:hypothetical protein